MKMKIHTIVCAMSVGILLPASVYALGPPVTHIFSNGTPANADDVNANFQELADRISEVPGGDQAMSFDFAGYGFGNIASKTFSVINPGSHDSEIRTYERPSANTTIVTITRQMTGTPLNIRKMTYVTSANDVRWTKREEIDANDGATLLYTKSISPGIVVRKNNMKIGQSWSSGSVVHVVDEYDELGDGFGIEPEFDTVATETRMLEAVEDVTVPAGTFQNCLKISNTRSGYFGTHLRVSWYCSNGIGLVKQYHGHSNGGGRLIELSNYSTLP
jgi:hypothetical protein